MNPTTQHWYRPTEPTSEQHWDTTRAHGWTWRDPRNCRPEEFGGPLAELVVPVDPEDLQGLAAEVAFQTLLAAGVISHDDTWALGDGVRVVRTDFDAGRVDVLVPIDRLDQLEGCESVPLPDPTSRIVHIDGGTWLCRSVGADPLRPIELGAALMGITGAADQWVDEAIRLGVIEGWPFDPETYVHHFCGTGWIDVLDRYVNAEEHPLIQHFVDVDE